MHLMKAVHTFCEHMSYKNYSENTIEAYRNDLTLLERYLGETYNGPAYLADVTRKDLQDFLYMLRVERKYEPTSHNRALYAIRSFYKYCYQKDLCQENMASNLDMVKEAKKERNYLMEDEVSRLIEAVEHPLSKYISWVLYYSGMRISECTSLKKWDVEMDRKMLRVVAGKGDESRSIPMNDKLFEILQHYKRSELIQPDTPYYFATRSGSISGEYYNRRLQEAAEKLNWKWDITAHIFRHSFASNLLRKGASLREIQKLLGHKNLETTAKYLHTNMAELAIAVNIL